jgi:hypothetical protein
MKLFPFFTLLFITQIACNLKNQPQKKAASITYLNTTWKDSAFKVENYDSKYTFINEVLNQAIYYFDVDNQNFKLQKIDSSDIYLFQKKENKWIKQFELECNHGVDLFDFNKDGFPDLIDDIRREQRVYFYNPQSKSFIYSDFYISVLYDIIDSSANVYCDHLIHISNDFASSLFTIENYQFVSLYGCDIVKTDTDSIGTFSLYKLYKIKPEEEKATPIFSKKTILDNYSFNHIKFWKDYYYNKKYTLEKLEE